MRTYVSAALLLLSPSLSFAQANAAAGCLIDPNATVVALVIREAASAQFAIVRECAANGDGDCAEAVLDEMDEDMLNDDERAVLELARGDTELLQGSSRRARRAYEEVLDLPDANRQLKRAAIERLVVRHIEDDDYDDVLERLEGLECGEWTPDLLFLQGRAHYEEGEFSSAESSAQAAIDAQSAAGTDVPAGWNILVQNAQVAASEEVVCTRERSANSNIPRRVCTTRTQRDAQLEAVREWQRTGDGFGGGVVTETIQ
jgi:tetratricopeptide (TPR) repeat protein